MRKIQTIALAASLVFSLAIAPTAQAKAKITRPSAPTIVSIKSSTPKSGKVDVTVKIILPKNNGGSAITGSKVFAGGKSCTMKNKQNTCVIRDLGKGKTLSVQASSKNKKGFGARSKSIRYVSGRAEYLPGPKLTITKNTCTSTMSKKLCYVSFESNQSSTFSWSTIVGIQQDGGYSPTGGMVEIQLLGPPQIVRFTIWATSIATGLTSHEDVEITISGNYSLDDQQ